MSYSIWVDYINFLKSVEATGSFAENQKITAIRKVFQKGIMNPMMNVENLWKDYCAFENVKIWNKMKLIFIELKTLTDLL
jgi:cleavage stimulation factor subunit 3